MKVSDRIRRALEEDIGNGILLPGDSIDEQALASRFKSSRTPVREALLQLKVQGMITSLPRNGAEVAKMDVQELLAIWELMAELECVCARLACQRMTQEERQALARVHQEAGDSIEREDVESWRVVNQKFHNLLYMGCRNPYLRQELLRLRARTGAYLKHSYSAIGRVRASYEQHGKLVSAILDNDPARAQAYMDDHLGLAYGAKGLADFIINLPKSMLSGPDEK